MSAELVPVSRETVEGDIVSRETGDDPGPSVWDGLATVSRETGPVTLSSGTYALYATPARGLHLTFLPVGHTADSHVEVPPGIVTLIRSAMSGKQPSMKDVMRAMKGMRR